MVKDFSIGYWIKRRRKSLDLTQKDLANLVGCALITIAKIESDQRRPSREIALLLAKHLAVPEEHHQLFVSVMRGEKSSLQLQKISFSASFAGAAASVPWSVPASDAPSGEFTRGVTLLKRISRGRLVGRVSELTLALSTWQLAVAGEANVLVIHGEPGVGKSRLALEILNHVRQQGGNALVGGCLSGVERSYAAFSRLLQNIREVPADLPPVVISDLKIIAPQWETRFPNATLSPTVDPLAEKLRLFESAFLFLRQIFQEKPGVLLIEDIHWADSGSLELIQSLARRFRETDQRLLMILTTRNETPAGAYDVTSLIDELQRGRLSTSIHLERFDLEGTRALLASIFEQEITDDFIDLIHRETQGNPFFIEEVCKDMIENGDIYWANGRWERGELSELHVPKSVQFAIQARLKKLPRTSVDVLRMAAILGRQFEFDTLRAALDLDDDELIQALESAKQAQIVIDTDNKGGGSFEFSHNLICTVLIEDTSGPRRRKLHQQAVQAIEKTQPWEYSILAWHCREADEKLRSAIYFKQAAERAMKAYAHEDALRLYSEALSLSTEDPAEMCRLHLLRERVYDLRGDRSMQVKDLQNARSNAEAAGDIRLLAEVELAFAGYHLQTSELDKVIEHVKTTIQLGEEANLPILQAQAYMLWGRALSETGELQEARECLTRAGDLGQKTGLKLIVARSLINLGNVDYRLGEYEAARQKYMQALESVRALGERRIECMTLNNLGNIAWITSSLDNALALYRESLSIAREIGDRLNEARTLSNIGSILTEQFQHAEALQNLEQALILIRELGQRGDEVMVLSHMGDVMESLGQYETAYSYKEQAMTIAREIEDLQAEAEILSGLSRIQIWLGNVLEAEQLAQAGIRLSHDHGMRAEEADSWQALGMASLVIKRWDIAAHAFSTALALFKEMALDQKSMAMSAELARLAEQKGDHARAMEYLRFVLPDHRPETISRIKEPSLCFSCSVVLQNEDPAAAALLLQNGHDTMEKTLKGIADAGAREHYRSKIPNHHSLMELWEKR